MDKLNVSTSWYTILYINSSQNITETIIVAFKLVINNHCHQQQIAYGTLKASLVEGFTSVAYLTI